MKKLLVIWTLSVLVLTVWMVISAVQRTGLLAEPVDPDTLVNTGPSIFMGMKPLLVVWAGLLPAALVLVVRGFVRYALLYLLVPVVASALILGVGQLTSAKLCSERDQVPEWSFYCR